MPLAIRYADGRHTYAPSVIRGAIKNLRKIFPEWKPRPDRVIKPPIREEIGGASFQSDYLYDLFTDTKIE